MRIRKLAVLILASLLCPVTLSAQDSRRNDLSAAEPDADEETQAIVVRGDGDRAGLHEESTGRSDTDKPTMVRRYELPEVTRIVKMINLFSLFGFCARYIYKPGYPYTETHYETTAPGPWATRTVAILYTTEYITLTSTVHVAPSPRYDKHAAAATPAYVAPVATAPVSVINLWTPARIPNRQDAPTRPYKLPRDLDFKLKSEPRLGCRPNQISLACSIALASRTTTVTVTRTVVPTLTEAWRVATVQNTITTTTTVAVGCPGIVRMSAGGVDQSGFLDYHPGGDPLGCCLQCFSTDGCGLWFFFAGIGCFQAIGAQGPHPDGHCYNGYGQYLAEPGWEYGDVGGPGPCASRFTPP